MTQNNKCPYCGAELLPDLITCPQCGKTVESKATTPPPLQQPPPLPVVPPFKHAAPSTPPILPTSGLPNPIYGDPGGSPPVNTPVPPPIITQSDHVLDVVGMVTRKTGVFSSELYHMVITGKRLIFALQTKEDQVNDVKKAREKAKQEGRNLLGQIGAQMATRSGEKYMGATPDLILLENPQNFAINIEEIVKVSVFHGDFEDSAPDSMEIRTTTQKLKFTISNAYGVEKQLKSVLGSKVH